MEREAIVETKNRWSKPLAIAVIVMTILVCIVGLGLNQTDIGDGAKTYQDNRAKAEKQDMFFSLDQIKQMYAVPESENGASLVTQVLPIIRKNKWDDTKKLTEQVVRDHWPEFESALGKLEEASGKKYLIFKRDLSNPIMVTYPEYSDLKNWVKFLSQMAHYASEKGDAKQAKRYLNVAAYLCVATDDEGTLIGNLVRVAQSTIVEFELQKIVHAHGKDTAWLDAVETTLKRLDEPYDFKKTLQLEHWFSITAVDLVMKDPQSFSNGIGSSSVPNVLRYAKYIPRFKNSNLSRIHEAYATTVAALPKDRYDFSQTRKAYESMDQFASRQGLSYTLLSLIAPVYSQTSQAMSKEVAYRNVLFQAVTLLKSGEDPAKGLPLKDRHILDLDGKHLKLKKVKGIWTVYSIGPDGADDGGADLLNMKGDWVVHLSK